MTKTLVVVESPAKARKIQKFLGPNYIVKASFGHIYDLPPKKLGVDLKTFKMEHTPMSGKKKVISELKKAFKQCGKKLILAPDPDREGEAIAYHIAKCLGAEPYTTPRISFTEITKAAILKAIQSPTTLSESAVKAQMTRRALDRILGYKISPFVKRETLTGTSAGRCQSPSLLLLKQKEDDIEKFNGTKQIRGIMMGMAERDDAPWETRCEMMKEFPTKNLHSFHWKITNVTKSKPISSNPPPPFITSTLLSAAANHLGMGTGRAKKMMQSMYEKGWITYIRTDSTVISHNAMKQIADYIREELNEKVVARDWNKKKGAHAQEAHECIRPTLIKRIPADIEGEYRRLYELIWNRSVASQMEAAESIRVAIEVNTTKQKQKQPWSGSKSYCVKAGWKSLEGVTETNPRDIPVPKKGGKWRPTEIKIEEHMTNPPRRYTDATFVSMLEKIGIGRPSTYASIIETIKNRGYASIKDSEGETMELRVQRHPTNAKQSPRDETVEIEWGRENKRLMLTHLGEKVCSYLYPRMESLLGIQMTADMEESLDSVCRGDTTYESTMKHYWDQLSKVLQTLPTKHAQKPSNERKIGTQTINGKKHTITFETTRYGPAIVRQQVGSDTKKEYGNVPKGADISSLSLDMAIRYLPTQLGTWKSEPVVAKQGKFGPYLQIGTKKPRYVSIPMEIWEAGITKPLAHEILQNVEKEESHAAHLVKSHASVGDIKKGPRGWYLVLKSKSKSKRGASKSLGDDILSVTKDLLTQIVEEMI